LPPLQHGDGDPGGGQFLSPAGKDWGKGLEPASSCRLGDCQGRSAAAEGADYLRGMSLAASRQAA
jgi:hypothetical protein